MRYSASQYARAFRELVAETPAPKRRALIRGFLATLAKNSGLVLLPEIIREYEAQRRKEKGVHAVVVHAPERLSEGGVARKLGFKAQVKSERDIRLRGGAVIELDDVRVDNSIAKRMGRIREALAK